MKISLIAALCLPCFLTFATEPVIVAHRGASKDAPENTLPAFQLAWQQGADAIEGDFWLSKDGHIVCIHDASTKRYAKTNLVVRDSTLEELRALDVGAYRGPEFKDTRIPTISEVFSTIPCQKKIYIEVKCGPEIIPALLKELKSSGLKKEQIVVISFKQQVIQEMKAQAPQYKAYWLCGFKKQKTGEFIPSLESVLEILKETRANGLSSNTNIPESFIEPIVKEGYEWHVWTVNDPKLARQFEDLGVQSITTDIPGKMLEHLSE
jgi:glycerophosphoryl diester phosphodiesterase